MSNRTRRWNGSRQPQQHRQDQIVNAIFNPEVHTASEQLSKAQLDTICEYSDQMKTMIENGHGSQVPTFFQNTFLTHVKVVESNLRQLAFLEKQKQTQQQREASPSGTSSHATSQTRIPSAKALVASLQNDPRKLREYQEEISRAAAAS